MRAPEGTFFLNERDRNGPTFEPFTRIFQLASVVNPHEFLINNIPKDRMLVLTNAHVRGIPQAALSVVYLLLQGNTQANMTFDIAVEFPEVIVNQARVLNWQGSVYILGAGSGQRTLRMVVNYSGAHASNTSYVGVHGIMVPRGNASPY